MKLYLEKRSVFFFSFSIGENREVLFYKHWLLEEGKKEKKTKEKRINFLLSFRPTMLIASCINIGPKKAGKIMNTNTSFCMQIEEKKSVRREEMRIVFC
jgi:hypothetical protein